MISSGFPTMKPGDYDDHSPHNLPSFFPKFQSAPQSSPSAPSLFHQRALKCNKSDDLEVNSHGGDPPPGPGALVLLPPSGDHAKKQKRDEEDSIEVSRRPRGRPPGSKNKPKPPVVPTLPTESAPGDGMRSHVFEVPAGHDIADSLSRFSRRRDVGLSVLSGSGPVSNITIRQPAASGMSTVTFHGRFEIMSISANFLPPSFLTSTGLASSYPGGLSVSVAGPQGQIVGGLISGPLMAAGTVFIVAATFTNPSFHRLPIEGDQSVSVSGDGSRSGGDAEAAVAHHQQQQQQPQHHHQHPPPQQQQQHHLHRPAGSLAETVGPGMSIYSSHLPSDVIWTPTARGPPPF